MLSQRPVDAGVVQLEARRPAPPPPDTTPEPPATCPAKCAGRVTPDLAAFAQTRGAGTGDCYNRALAIEAPRVIAGKMRVALILNETGGVCSASVIQSDMPDYMNNCVLQTLSRPDYPAPAGGCFRVVFPLSFVPSDGGAPPP